MRTGLIALILILIYCNTCLAKEGIYFGGELSGIIPTRNFPIKSEPSDIKGFRVSGQVHSSKFDWKKLTLFLDLSYAYLNASQNSISIVALAPILRYQFFSFKTVNPFIDLSAGPAYLTNTMFVKRNLGIHYSFQDMIGLGLSFGKNNNTAISWKIIHYSNASLSKHNSGITVPLVLSISHVF